MAKTNEQKAKRASRPSDTLTSIHEGFGLQYFRRGRDKQWRFAGQQPDEVVRMIVRRHWWFLVQPALPFLGSILLLFLVFGGAIALPAPSALWFLAEAAVFLLVIATGAWFAYRDLIVWWFETYLITNKRIISSANFLLKATRKEVPIERVQQVGVDTRDSLLGILLDFGTVHVYLTGGDLVMKDIPVPKAVKDAIQGVSEDFKAQKKPEKPIPKPKDPDIAAAIEELAKEKTVPTLPDADKDYPPLRNPDRLRGPRRRFSSIFRVTADIHYFSGEYSVKYLQHSPYILYRNMALPILALLFVLPIGLVTPRTVPGVPNSWWLILGALILGILLWIFFVYVDYLDDVYILTNRRIIDIERKFFFIFESRLEVEYKNIRDVRVVIPSVFEQFLNIGNVYVETPGSSPNIIFESIDRPFEMQDLVLGIKGHKDKEDKVKKDNDEKKLLRSWFSTMFATLEGTNKSYGAPDLKNMDLLSAIYRVQEMELEVEVLKEDVPNVAMEPGRVISQNPPAGTLMNKGSKIEVVLSKR
ncbi:MAG: PH domain-containing protein [Chloroflexi bacterium]|nr:PH domain-containing protein [Ktedonobacteraceae bacterium]MBV8823327.1 PH domain-containing protein [Ktedonobacteraceae bacterium]MBV9019121.1 PH domain-containing protein [Ktedonobacteraceae bacterium]MBV9707403.1 PH domain-containing protein [Chloroflexota bacterium]